MVSEADREKKDRRDLMDIVKENGYTVVKGLAEGPDGLLGYEKVILTQTDEQEEATSGSLSPTQSTARRQT